MDKTIVIKVGGSTLSLSDQEPFSFNNANKLKETLTPFINDGYKFVLVAGGGFMARKYRDQLKSLGFPDYDQHYAGTAQCNINAVLLRAVFGNLANEKIIAFNDFDTISSVNFSKPVQLAGGGVVGISSDWDAAKLATITGADSIISLKDVEGVFEADPDSNPNAKRLDNISWDQYLTIIGNPAEHLPGANFPVDPESAQFAKQKNLKFYIISGKAFENLGNLIKGDNFTGTKIY